jgi:hypothetical protein
MWEPMNPLIYLWGLFLMLFGAFCGACIRG